MCVLWYVWMYGVPNLSLILHVWFIPVVNENLPVIIVSCQAHCFAVCLLTALVSSMSKCTIRCRELKSCAAQRDSTVTTWKVVQIIRNKHELRPMQKIWILMSLVCFASRVFFVRHICYSSVCLFINLILVPVPPCPTHLFLHSSLLPFLNHSSHP